MPGSQRIFVRDGSRSFRQNSRRSDSPYQAPKSQEVLRQTGFKTTFWAQTGNPQSGARSAKPRMVRGSGQFESLFSKFEMGLLAGEKVVHHQQSVVRRFVGIFGLVSAEDSNVATFAGIDQLSAYGSYAASGQLRSAGIPGPWQWCPARVAGTKPSSPRS